MREKTVKLLREYIKSADGYGFDCLVDAVEMYSAEKTLKSVYAEIALSRCKSVCAVEKAVAVAVSEAETETPETPKAFIARVKERILFGNKE